MKSTIQSSTTEPKELKQVLDKLIREISSKNYNSR
jgi:hypothetical protein